MFTRLIDKIGRQLLGNSFWLLVDKVARLFFGLVVGVLVARYLGPANLGLWNYGLAIFTFFTVFPSLGLEYTTARELVKADTESQGKIISTVLFLKFLGAIVGITIAVSAIYVLKGSTDILFPIVFILTLGFLFMTFDAFDYYFQSKLIQKRTVTAKLSAFLVVSGYKAVLIWINAPLLWFVWSSTIEFFIAAVGLLYVFNSLPNRPRLAKPNLHLAKKLLKDSTPFAASAILVLIYYRVDQVMITELLGEEQNGIYAVAVRIYELFMFLPTVLVSSFLPVITKKFQESEKEFKTTLKQLYAILTYAAILSSLAVWFLAPWIMNLLYGASFSGSGAALQVIALGFYPVFLGIATGNYLIVRNLKGFNLLRSFIGLSINVALNFWLIPIYGIVGAAIASVISNFASTVLIIFLKDNHNHLGLMLSPFNVASVKRFLKY
ncbi:MAG: flippase [Luteibaculaceae bacterium]